MGVAFEDKAGRLVATAAQIAKHRGSEFEAIVLEQASPVLVNTGYDNWNGGTDFYKLILEVPIATYVQAEGERDELENSIKTRISQLIRREGGHYLEEVVITSMLVDDESRSVMSVEGDDSSGEEIVPAFWQQGYFRLFISHVSAHKAYAHQLKCALAVYQIAAFVAHDDIEPTKAWQTEIESALRTMDAVVAMVSPGFVGSHWCDQEVGFALGRRKLVVPLCMGADPHGFLAKSQGLQISSCNADQVAARVFDVLLRNVLSTNRMTDVLVQKLVASITYQSAKETIGLIEKAPRISELQGVRMMQAIDDNDQVARAYGVPEKIRILVSRIGTTPS